MNDITMDAGDSRYLDFTINDDTLDLTAGGNVNWFLFNGSIQILSKTGTITGKNTFTVKLDPPDTSNLMGVYPYKAKVTDNFNDIDTSVKGHITVE